MSDSEASSVGEVCAGYPCFPSSSDEECADEPSSPVNIPKHFGSSDGSPSHVSELDQVSAASPLSKTTLGFQGDSQDDDRASEIDIHAESDDLMDRVMATLMEQIDSKGQEGMKMFKKNLESLPLNEQGECEFRVGSICTGSGMDFHVAVSFVHYVNKILGVKIKLVKSFACEKVKWKREWIQRAHAPNAIFGSAKDLANGRGIDHTSGKEVDVPGVDNCIGGFPCTDSSLLNNSRWKHNNCVKKGEGKTGETLP